MPKPPKSAEDADPDYEPIWPRLAERMQQETAEHLEEQSTAAALAAELLALEPAARREALREARFHTVALMQELLLRARAALLGASPPGVRVDEIHCALDLLRRLQGTKPPGLLASLRAEALGALAESHLRAGGLRRLRRLRRAEHALAQAAEALRDSPDSEAHGRFCQRLAWLRARQGRLGEAVTLIARAAELADAVGDRELAGRLEMRENLLRRELGEEETAPVGPRRKELRAGELQAILESLTDPSEDCEGFPWRETFLARLTETAEAEAFRTVGRVIEEHLAEFARYLPAEAEVFPWTDLRAAAADLRYLQGYLAARGRAPFEDSGLTAEQSALCHLASELALDLAPLLARLREALAASSPAA